MALRQIRLGQLIAPFGPGSLYTDKKGIPYIVCGLDYWYHSSDPVKGMVMCEKPEEFERFEPRLAQILRVSRFLLPPDHRQLFRGRKPAPNAGLFIPGQRFPTWYRHSRSGELRKFNLSTKRVANPADGGRFMPVRFVSVCKKGHIGEFPWKEWIACSCSSHEKLTLQDRGGSELTSIVVECKGCGRKRNLSGATTRSDDGMPGPFERSGITCSGERPWLGEKGAEYCGAPLSGALINQSNLYFPRTISAITLPDLREQDPEVLTTRAACEAHKSITAAHLMWSLNDKDGAVAALLPGLASVGVDVGGDIVRAALESLFDPDSVTIPGEPNPSIPDSQILAFRRAEYNVLKLGIDDRVRSPDLRVIATNVPARFTGWIERVHLVERLRETRVLHGFDRLEPSDRPLDGMPEAAMDRLFLHPPSSPEKRWLPAIEVFGEGIFIQLRDSAISSWQHENREWLEERLSDAFVGRVIDVYLTNPPLGFTNWQWASRYLLVHSLAHILINQLVFECGYGTASLRERLYIAEDASAPMSGFLIYTAAGDAEGTLGGLVQLGLPERLGDLLERAIVRASWCSADPICSENRGGTGSRLANLSACHACILLPENSCETINHGLDRALVVGTPSEPKRGAMSSLLESLAHTY
jgi:hypothetical protein